MARLSKEQHVIIKLNKMSLLKIVSLFSFTIAILLVGASVFYYVVILIPKQEQSKADAQIQPKQIVPTLSPTIVPTSTSTPTSIQVLIPSIAASSNSAQLSDCITKAMEQYQATRQTTGEGQNYQKLLYEARARISCQSKN